MSKKRRKASKTLPDCLTDCLLLTELKPAKVDVYVSTDMRHALLPIRQILGYSLHGICQYALDFAEQHRLTTYNQQQFQLRKLVREKGNKKPPRFVQLKVVKPMLDVKYIPSFDGCDVYQQLNLSLALFADYSFLPARFDAPISRPDFTIVEDPTERRIREQDYDEMLKEWTQERDAIVSVMPDVIATNLVKWFIPYGNIIAKEANCHVGSFDREKGFDPLPRFARNIT